MRSSTFLRSAMRSRSGRPATSFSNGNNARMLEACGDECLAQEANLADMAAGDQLLDRDVATELDVVSARHAAQPAAPMLAENVITLRIAMPRDQGHSARRRRARS